MGFNVVHRVPLVLFLIVSIHQMSVFAFVSHTRPIVSLSLRRHGSALLQQQSLPPLLKNMETDCHTITAPSTNLSAAPTSLLDYKSFMMVAAFLPLMVLPWSMSASAAGDVVGIGSMGLAGGTGATIDVQAILAKASGKAVEGGMAGASAAAVQVLSLMWLRTAMNYQYRYGTSTSEALSLLYKEGGIPRLYQGLPFALVQGPMSRFGDTAANALVLSLVESLDLASGGTTPIFLRTALASCGAALWRVVLLPIDTAKTCLQVDGARGLDVLRERIRKEGGGTLYAGAIASSLATLVGHYPWFLTYNYLSEHLPTATEVLLMSASAGGAGEGQDVFPMVLLAGADPRVLTLLRSAFIGLCASSLSDVCSNSLRVLKTSRQTEGLGTSLSDLARGIIATEGWQGLLGRGLQTRLLVNALQGMLFSVLFKYFQGAK